jgi:hypothetical protein
VRIRIHVWKGRDIVSGAQTELFSEKKPDVENLVTHYAFSLQDSFLVLQSHTTFQRLQMKHIIPYMVPVAYCITDYSYWICAILRIQQELLFCIWVQSDRLRSRGVRFLGQAQGELHLRIARPSGAITPALAHARYEKYLYTYHSV